MSDNQPCETHLLDLLRRVPSDARGIYEHDPTSHSFFPYGDLCNRAADEIERLQAVVDAARVFAASEDNCNATLDAEPFSPREHGAAIQAMQDCYETFRNALRTLDGEVKP